MQSVQLMAIAVGVSSFRCHIIATVASSLATIAALTLLTMLTMRMYSIADTNF